MGTLGDEGPLESGRADLVMTFEVEVDAALTVELTEGFGGVGVRAAGAVLGLGFDLATGAAGGGVGLVLGLAGAEGFVLAVALVGFIGSWFPWVTLRGRRRPATENCLKNSHEAGEVESDESDEEDRWDVGSTLVATGWMGGGSEVFGELTWS